MKLRILRKKLKSKVKEKLSGITSGEIAFKVLSKFEDFTIGYVNFINDTIENNKQAIKNATSRLRQMREENEVNFNKKIGGEDFDIVKD